MSNERHTKCVTGTGGGGSTPSYVGFHVAVVVSSGFTFSTDSVLKNTAQQVASPAAGGVEVEARRAWTRAVWSWMWWPTGSA